MVNNRVSGKMPIEKAIGFMVGMTQEAFTACLECGSVPVAEFREEELRKFAKEHPECVQYHQDMFPGGISERVPDWTLVQPAACLISGICCNCCERAHKGTWGMCQQARLDYEKEEKKWGK